MKKMISLMLAVFMLLGSAALAAGFDPAKHPVAFAADDMNPGEQRIAKLGFLEAAQALGYTDVRFIGAGEAEAFAKDGGEGLLIWSGDDSCYEIMASLAKRGAAVGIPFFSHIRPDGTYPEGLTFSMGCDPARCGRLAAELMAERLSGKNGCIALAADSDSIEETAAADAFAEKWASLDGIWDLNGIRLLEVTAEAAADCLDVLEENPDMAGVFAGFASAWADAALQAGKARGELVLVGTDASSESLDRLEAGDIAAIVAQPIYDGAYRTMEYLDIILRGGDVPMWTELEPCVITLDGGDENGPGYHRGVAAEAAAVFR